MIFKAAVRKKNQTLPDFGFFYWLSRFCGKDTVSTVPEVNWFLVDVP